jgi:hypothetical protein
MITYTHRGMLVLVLLLRNKEERALLVLMLFALAALALAVLGCTGPCLHSCHSIREVALVGYI